MLSISTNQEGWHAWYIPQYGLLSRLTILITNFTHVPRTAWHEVSTVTGEESLHHTTRYYDAYIQWNLSIVDTTGILLAVMYREVSLLQR